MSKSADLIKSISKKPVGEKPTFGTDPRDPWSTKAGITEDAILNKFLKSRGINPLYVSKDQKVAHSKMGEFKKWKQDHMFEQTTEPSPTLRRLKQLQKSQRHQTPIVKGVAESIDKKDTVSFDIPLLIRVLEFAREELKSDVLLHKMVERLISIRGKGTLTMNEYGKIVKEEVEILGESYYGPRADKLIAHSHALYKAGDKENSKRAHTIAMKAGERYHKNPVNRDKAISSIMSGANKDYTSGKRYTGDSVEIEGTPIQEGSAALRLAQALRKEREARELKDKSREAAEKNEKAKQPVQQQENTMDSLAATGAPNDCANNPDDVAPKDKNKKLIQMSKSARIIKSIYNRKNMKEETFDTEKEDKSVATYGKKPKITDTMKKIEATDGKTQAAAIMTGGTTLTGTPRDTVEIDPMMKLKPGLMGQSGQAIKPKNNNR